MNSHLAMHLVETRQTELCRAAAQARAAANGLTPSWTDRLRGAVGRWQRQPLPAATLTAPAARRASTAV